MPRRPHIGALRLRNGEPQSVPDLSRHDLIVADQPRQNWKACRIRRGPRRRSQSIREQVEDRARVRFPARHLRERIVQLIKDAVVRVDRDGVPVARALASAFDRPSERNRVRPRIAFTRVQESSRILGLRAGHRDERNPDWPSVVRSRPEIRMHRKRRPDRRDISRRTRRYGKLIDRRVPYIVSRQHRARPDSRRLSLCNRSKRK